LATEADWLLPNLFIDGVRQNQIAVVLVAACVLALCAVALGLLWFRRRSVLDLWLMVMCYTLGDLEK